ncbi:MAG TPA: VOC family protein [Caulobacteraceae bacterium]|jgi:predicted 3-demethylubiquinone-9 3-methyltransferase (glyoxalase superfamily)
MPNVQKITPFLWFDHQAEEAANFYVSIFPGSRMGQVARYGEGMPGPAGSAMTVAFELCGQPFTALNGGPLFSFTEAVSFVIHCADQAEIDHYWDRLTEGGKPVQCGWLKDRYGLSWQVVPDVLLELVSGPDAAVAGRVMQAMMGMVKLDIAKLREAAER